MRCIVNGQPVELPEGCAVSDLLREQGLDRAACAVEVNESLAPRAQHDAWTLSEGDRVEIVTLVGGG